METYPYKYVPYGCLNLLVFQPPRVLPAWGAVDGSLDNHQTTDIIPYRLYSIIQYSYIYAKIFELHCYSIPKLLTVLARINVNGIVSSSSSSFMLSSKLPVGGDIDPSLTY